MKKNYTHIAILLDRSGSMASIARDIVGGFNTFIEDQKKLEGTATVTLVQFDHDYEVVYQTSDLKKITPLVNFSPRGSTSLHDSLGKLINSTGKELALLPENKRPDKVIILVITDGGENSSREFTGQQVKELTKHQEENYKWEFIFIGANQDSVLTASTLNINNVMNFTSSTAGVNSMYARVSSSVSNYRSVGIMDVVTDDETTLKNKK